MAKGKLPPPPPLPLAPSEVTRVQIEAAVKALLMASAARVARYLNFVGREEVRQVFDELEAMAKAGELQRSWINHQVIFHFGE